MKAKFLAQKFIFDQDGIYDFFVQEFIDVCINSKKKLSTKLRDR